MNEPIQPELLLAHRDFLRSLARSLVRDEHRAEDVVQQTWLAALERPPRDRSSLRSWLSSVARNAALNMSRGERRRREREQAVAPREAAESTEDIVLRLSVQQRLVAAVIELDEPYRSTILLRFYEDLPPTKIAERTGTPLETVRSRLRRGLHQLRLKLEPDDVDDRRALAIGLLALADRSPEPGLVLGVTKSLLKGLSAMDLKLKISTAAGLCASFFVVFWLTTSGEENGTDSPEPVSEELSQLEPARTEPRAVATTAPANETSSIEPPSPPSALAETGTLIVRVRTEGDRDVSGIGVTVLPRRATALLDSRALSTDVNGEAVFAEATPGRYDVTTDRGAEGAGEVVAGEESRVDLVLPTGLSLDGIVVDADGDPVADAEIWLSEASSSAYSGPGSRQVAQTLRWRWGGEVTLATRLVDQPGQPVTMLTQPDPGPALLRGSVVARTEADGTFHIELVPEGTRYLGARAKMFEPSPLYQVEQHREGVAVDVRIVLPRAGGAVSGVVRGPDGEPIAGATVQVGDRHGLVGTRTSQGDIPGARPHLLRTDGEGRFAANGVAVGRTQIAARAPGFAPAGSRIEVTAGQTATVEIQLQPGATVEGTVYDVEGQPAAGVKVEVFGFESAFVETGSNGQYRLDGLAPGRSTIVADGGVLGTARDEVSLSGRVPTDFDLQLQRGRIVTGLVVDEAGDPLVGWEVNTVWFSRPSMVTTNEEGRFELINVSEAAEEVLAKPPGRTVPWSFATVAELPPGVNDVRIVVPSSSHPSAFVIGRVESPTGSFEKNVPIEFFQLDRDTPITHVWNADAETGGFRFGPLKPGPYRFTAVSDVYGRAPLGDHVLEPNATVDLGTTRLMVPGQLIVEAESADGAPLEDVSLEIFQGGRPAHARFIAGETVILQPGTCLLRAGGRNAATTEREVTIQSEQETRVELTLLPGVRCYLRFLDPAVGPPLTRVDVTVTGEGGEGIVSAELVRFSREYPPNDRVTLRPGRYRVVATTDQGLRAETWIEVDADTEPDRTIDVQF